MNLKKFSVIVFTIYCSCTEPFTAVTEGFEDVLVVEATITDELKTQKIKVSRTYKLEEGTVPSLETNAQVTVEGSDGMVHNFEHSGDGVYTSIQEFQAQEGVSYKLNIETANGQKYSSTAELLPPKVEIDSVYAELITIESGTGVQVFVDSKERQQNANYFRYEYEETYKIIANRFHQYDASLDTWQEEGLRFPRCGYDPELILRPLEQKTCYSSNFSHEILVKSLNGLDEARISRFPIRFIPTDDNVIRDRYSILVKQFVQSVDANNFYRILKELGGDQSLLIDNQPGFVRGNIFSVENKNEKVIGFFDVSSMSSKRIFFDYLDFDIQEKPAYPFECEILDYDYSATGPPISQSDERAILFHFFSQGFKYYGQDECRVFVVSPQCGDCTTFASSEKPLFWED
ncbi:hypothetical protein MHTCC0001_20940 [Flavobacteriaceae bacterium MHTCC 0001]